MGSCRHINYLCHLHIQRPHSSSFLGLPYRVLYMNPNKELLWGLWVCYHWQHEVQIMGTAADVGLDVANVGLSSKNERRNEMK